MNNNQSILYIDQTWGLFIGQFSQNTLHKHYALQITIASNQDFEISDEANIQVKSSKCLVNSNIRHRLKVYEPTLIILINPMSSLGHLLFQKYQHVPITDLNGELEKITGVFKAYGANDISINDLIENIRNALKDIRCNCVLEDHFMDTRIYNAISYLEQHAQRIVPLEEIASFSSLSPTRFLHLFKEKTHSNYRRYQLWIKLIRSLPFLKTHSITETAHQFGFTDSSHYSRTLKETFGISPRFITSLNKSKT